MDNFKQKKIGHIFHYTKTIDALRGILDNGFQPSYCREQIGELLYLIPMVSFCNLSIKDVDLYMRYGDYGIGMSVEWALRNRISPVIYVHENSPFNNLHTNVNKILFWDMVEKQMERFTKIIDEAVEKGEKPDTTFGVVKEKDTALLAEVNRLTVPLLQFYKNWKVAYREIEIVTYQEREWRYIPELTDEKKIVSSSEQEYAELIDEHKNPKPHLPKYTLPIDSIKDLKYIIIKEANERNPLIEYLTNRFGQDNLREAIVSGKLMILTNEQVRNDF